MNRDRIIEINRFLAQFRDELLAHPELTKEIINGDNVYYNLVRFNTTESINDSKLFKSWIEKNNRDNTSVFVDERWDYFCQFVSSPEEMINSINHHKIYLSLKHDYLEEGVNLLFDYLNSENIPHRSKIGKYSRDDQIVIRVNSHEDCEKVVNFIKNNQFIQEGKKTANPFSFQYDGVALASDGDVSYNNCIAKVIETYLKEMVDEHRIGDINVNTFIDFCTDYYNRYFVNKEDVDRLFKDFDIYSSEFNLYEIVDYKYAFQLFLNGLRNDFDYNSYIEFIDDKKKTIDQAYKEFSYSFELEKYLDLFNELCSVMVNKYGLGDGILQINAFVNGFEVDCITRDKDLRRRVGNKPFVDFVKKYLKENNITLEEYIKSNYSRDKSSMFSGEKSELLRQCVYTTYDYHERIHQSGEDFHNGMEYAKSSLKLLLRDGNYNGFTRTNDVRQVMMDNLTRDEVFEILKNEIGMNINSNELDVIINEYVHTILWNERFKKI